MAPTSKDLIDTARRVRLAARYERLAWATRGPVISGQVMYESFSGNGMLDHPEALFSAALRAPDLQHLTHVWAITEAARRAPRVRQFEDDPRVRFVTQGSVRYHEALARSETLVNNATFPPEFAKRPGQTYVNTWHGTPLKHMGYDIPGGGPATRNIIRNFVNADYLLSANDFMTTRMYEQAYKLRGIYRGRIVQTGSPRIDHQFVTPDEQGLLRQELSERGVAVDPADRIALYAPTWRGSFYAPLNDIVQVADRVRKLNRTLAGAGWRVLLKVHQVVYEFARRDPALREILVPNDIPTNSVLAVSDALITDYSSIFVDFLATGRPVLFHLPDVADYGDSRGLYLEPSRLPGPACRTVDQLAARLAALGTGGPEDAEVSHAHAYGEARERFTAHEDGGAADRVLDIVFRGRTSGPDIREDHSDGRTSILIHMGGMRSNGITKSALSLMDHIDHTKYDVSAFYTDSVRPDRLANEALINPAVRLFPRIGGINGSKLLWPGREWLLARGRRALPPFVRRRQLRSMHEEWVRCFGDSRFDHIVDFSGYNPFPAQVLLQGKALTRSVFLHNDLMADSAREVDGRRPHERNLHSMFHALCEFDRLVSVSASLSEINRQKLSRYADPASFVSAVNTVNERAVIRLAHGATEPGLPLAPGTEVAATLPAAIESLSHRWPMVAIENEVLRRQTIRRLMPAGRRRFTYVTAGRLSPEKNHDRLLRAFDLVHREHPDTSLVIMGGGPLMDSLKELVSQLGLASAVTLAGQQPNPYAVMAQADCFVLSSDYEGQPLVLLEALVLGLPIVTTAFDSVRGALPEGQGLVVPCGVEPLAEGLVSAKHGAVPPATFDPTAYNDDAVTQFLVAIGALADDPDDLPRPGRPVVLSGDSKVG